MELVWNTQLMLSPLLWAHTLMCIFHQSCDPEVKHGVTSVTGRSHSIFCHTSNIQQHSSSRIYSIKKTVLFLVCCYTELNNNAQIYIYIPIQLGRLFVCVISTYDVFFKRGWKANSLYSEISFPVLCVLNWSMVLHCGPSVFSRT